MIRSCIYAQDGRRVPYFTSKIPLFRVRDGIKSVRWTSNEPVLVRGNIGTMCVDIRHVIVR